MLLSFSLVILLLSFQVCSIHFLDGKPTDANPVPQLHLGYSKKVTPGRKAPTHRLFSPSAKTDDVAGQLIMPAMTKPVTATEVCGITLASTEQPMDCIVNQGSARTSIGSTLETTIQASPETKEVGCQWEDIVAMDHPYACKAVPKTFVNCGNQCLFQIHLYIP